MDGWVSLSGVTRVTATVNRVGVALPDLRPCYPQVHRCVCVPEDVSRVEEAAERVLFPQYHSVELWACSAQRFLFPSSLFF